MHEEMPPTLRVAVPDPPSSDPPSRLEKLARPVVGASPGTLAITSDERPEIMLIDYGPHGVSEHPLKHIDDVIPYLIDDNPSITWIDVRGIGHAETFHRLGEIFKLHPLALEDVVNVPQRPKSDVYDTHQLIVSRMVRLGEKNTVHTEQLGILFGEGFVLTVQEEPEHDVLGCVRERIRLGRGTIRTRGADYLAYALLDAVIDAFFPVLELLGEHLEDMEAEAILARTSLSKKIHDIKRDLLTIRRAIWPQRDLLAGLLRGESPLVAKDTILYLRDTYDHAIQVMDMVETYREIASGLMDLYLSGVSNRMNEIMKVLTILSTVFLPITFIAGVYGMNFDPEASPLNMPELKWRYGYIFSVILMMSSVGGLLLYYRSRGWLGEGNIFGKKKPPKTSTSSSRD
ncbi:MAG: magnesium/cobalt transporter CorA [Polyangiaceae bacterium]|nr:magnesium/cobalt transporter CorA [Polyangiaceae bacterium]